MLLFVHIIGGFLLLIAGGEVVVKGAVGLAKRLGISSVVIGLTVVAFGTSAPEMVISIQSVMSDHPDIAIGNVVGSNIANILLVVGATTLVLPIATHRSMARRDGSVMMFATIMLALFCIGGVVGLWEAALLAVVITIYTAYTVYDAKRSTSRAVVEGFEEESGVSLPLYLSVTMCVAGIGLLAIGSDIMINGAVELAKRYGWSEAVIGATIIAVGGSSPELITSLVAAFRRHADIGLANVVGSNIFNATAVMGVAGVIAPIPVNQQFLAVDIRVMLVVTVLFFIAMLTRKHIGRVEGVLMLAAYAGYIGWQYNLIS